MGIGVDDAPLVAFDLNTGRQTKRHRVNRGRIIAALIAEYRLGNVERDIRDLSVAEQTYIYLIISVKRTFALQHPVDIGVVRMALVAVKNIILRIGDRHFDPQPIVMAHIGVFVILQIPI